MELNYTKCPECGYVNDNQPDVCPSCGFDLKAYRDELQAQEEAAEQAQNEAEQARVADLANRAYSFISETMDGATKGEDENKNHLFSFIAAFLDGSNIGKFESETEKIVLLLSALYRYYDANKDAKNDRCYDIIYTYHGAIDLMGRYLSSSKNNRLKSTVGCLTPSKSIEFYFNFIITELEFELSGKSPFMAGWWLESCVDTFVRRFLEDDEFSKNEELKGAIEQYVTYLHNTYEKHDKFSDCTMEDFYIPMEDDYCDSWSMNCPHCDSAIKFMNFINGEEYKIKCAVCKKSFMFSPEIYCPECGVSGDYDRPFGDNLNVCTLCGLKYDAKLTDPDDDEGAIDSVLDDGSET